MTVTDHEQAAFDAVARLPALTPDPERAARTRRRCRAALEPHGVGDGLRRGLLPLPPVAIGVLGSLLVLYLGSLILTTLRVYDAFR